MYILHNIHSIIIIIISSIIIPPIHSIVILPSTPAPITIVRQRLVRVFVIGKDSQTGETQTATHGITTTVMHRATSISKIETMTSMERETPHDDDGVDEEE